MANTYGTLAKLTPAASATGTPLTSGSGNIMYDLSGLTFGIAATLICANTSITTAESVRISMTQGLTTTAALADDLETLLPLGIAGTNQESVHITLAMGPNEKLFVASRSGNVNFTLNGYKTTTP